jgi:hypothetical protein
MVLAAVTSNVGQYNASLAAAARTIAASATGAGGVQRRGAVVQPVGMAQSLFDSLGTLVRVGVMLLRCCDVAVV